VPPDVPAWVATTAEAAATMERSAEGFLALATRAADVAVREIDDAEAVLRLARGIRRKMEGWQRRLTTPA